MAKEKQKNTQRLTLEVENFGPIGKAKVDFRPLTIFVGKSNTGKTYLAKLIYALREAISRSYPVRRASYGLPSRMIFRRRLMSESRQKPLKELAKLIKDNQKETAKKQIKQLFESVINEVVADVSLSSDGLNENIAECFGAGDIKDLINHSSRSSKIEINNCDIGSRGVSHLKFFTSMTIRKSTDSPPPKNSFVITDKFLNETYELVKKQIDPKETRERRLIIYELPYIIASSIERLFLECIGQLRYPCFSLPSGRGGIMESHRAVVSSALRGATRAAIRDQDPIPKLPLITANFVEMLIESENDPRIARSIKESNKKELIKNLEDEILYGKIEIKSNLAGYPDFYYKAKNSTKLISLIRTSSMISELAPLHILLSQTRFGAEGDVLIFDEPESHLHPELQQRIARWIAYAVKAGIKCIVATHSDTFLEQIANLVQMSKIPEGEDKKRRAKNNPILNKEDVGVWLFEQKVKNKPTKVKEARINEESGEYLVGYDEIFTDLYNEGSRILEKIPE